MMISGIVTIVLVVSLATGDSIPVWGIVTNLFLIVGTLLVGIILLREDGISGIGIATGDEGQRDAQVRAQSLAFYTAYFGLIAVFVGASLAPWVRAASQLLLGMLLLLVMVTWLGGYMWYRWWA